MWKISVIEEIPMINRPHYIDAVEKQLDKETIIIFTCSARSALVQRSMCARKSVENNEY